MTTSSATIDSRRFRVEVEVEVEGISTERARRELRLPTGTATAGCVPGGIRKALARLWETTP